MANIEMTKAHSELSSTQLQLVTSILNYFSENSIEPGTRITEEWLASTFHVSRSPVRAVMRFLEEHGILVRKGRGLFVPSDPQHRNVGRIALPEAAEAAAYEAIARDRLNGKIRDLVPERQLMRDYGLSRGLALKVLNRFAQEGLVEKSAGYGWRFLPMLDTPEAVHASYRFRLILEPAGLLEPTFSVDHEKLAELREQHIELLSAESQPFDGHHKKIFEINSVFHETLARFSGNDFIIEAIRKQNLLRRLNEYYSNVPGRVDQRINEHIDIIDAILRDEIKWASILLRRHLELGAKYVYKNDM